MSMLSYFFKSIGNLFLPPVTVAFPAKPRDYPIASRGALLIDINTCIFCGICVRVCPADALVVEKPAKTWSLEQRRCVSCAACVVACPKKCLHLSSQPPSPFVASEKKSSQVIFTGPSDTVSVSGAGGVNNGS